MSRSSSGLFSAASAANLAERRRPHQIPHAKPAPTSKSVRLIQLVSEASFANQEPGCVVKLAVDPGLKVVEEFMARASVDFAKATEGHFTRQFKLRHLLSFGVQGGISHCAVLLRSIEVNAIVAEDLGLISLKVAPIHAVCLHAASNALRSVWHFLRGRFGLLGRQVVLVGLRVSHATSVEEFLE